MKNIFKAIVSFPAIILDEIVHMVIRICEDEEHILEENTDSMSHKQ